MTSAELDQQVADLTARLPLHRKLFQLAGAHGLGVLSVLVKLGFYVFVLKGFPRVSTGRDRRYGIPALSFTDGPRGVVIGRSTAFPVAIARAATWNPELEAEVGRAVGYEARWQGANYFAGLCVNLVRHPAWGRAQESYGEDGFLTATLACGLLVGLKSQNLMVCAKHFALNSIENSRFYVDVSVDPQVLHEVYLPQFRKLVEAGVDSIMSAYNRVNDTYCGENHELLTGVLRTTWDFKGFVSSDWMWGVHNTEGAIAAGMDLEMPRAKYFGRRLLRAVRAGRVSEALVGQSLTRVLRAKLKWLAAEGVSGKADPLKTWRRTHPEPDWKQHHDLARRVAEEAMVLLENRDLLPIAPGTVGSIGVFGPLAQATNLGDEGSSRVRSRSAVTILEGFKKIYEPATRVRFDAGSKAKRLQTLAAACACAIVVVGYQPRDEGENIYSNRQPGGSKRQAKHGGDRASLFLSQQDFELIRKVCAVNANTLVVIVAGSAVIIEPWVHLPRAILQAFYPGAAGGLALADLVSGSANPSGKLPFSIPRSEDHLVPFDSRAPRVAYSGLHGYRWLENQGIEAAYPFGFGLSYTRFGISNPGVHVVDNDEIILAAQVKNEGPRSGATVLQVYSAPALGDKPVARRLVAFQKVWLEAGATHLVRLVIQKRELQRYNPANRTWFWETSRYSLGLGTSARAADLTFLDLTLPEPSDIRDGL